MHIPTFFGPARPILVRAQPIAILEKLSPALPSRLKTARPSLAHLQPPLNTILLHVGRVRRKHRPSRTTVVKYNPGINAVAYMLLSHNYLFYLKISGIISLTAWPDPFRLFNFRGPPVPCRPVMGSCRLCILWPIVRILINGPRLIVKLLIS